MNEKLLSSITNPIKCKLLIEINSKKTATAKSLCETYPDIPQATLYRYLNKMLKEGIIKVVEENQIRGTIEKVYSLNFDFKKELQENTTNFTGKTYMQLVMQYMLGLLNEFREYTSQSDIDIANDGSGFTLYPVYLSSEEIHELAEKFSDLLQPYREHKNNSERNLHSIAFIITPPKLNQ